MSNSKAADTVTTENVLTLCITGYKILELQVIEQHEAHMKICSLFLEVAKGARSERWVNMWET